MHGFKSYFPSSLYTPTAASAVADAKRGAAPFAAPVAGFAPSNFQHPAAGFMAASSQEYGIDYFLKGALAGGICCSVTHGALTPRGRRQDTHAARPEQVHRHGLRL